MGFGIPFYNQEVYGKRNPYHSMNIILAVFDAKSISLIKCLTLRQCAYVLQMSQFTQHISLGIVGDFW